MGEDFCRSFSCLKVLLLEVADVGFSKFRIVEELLLKLSGDTCTIFIYYLTSANSKNYQTQNSLKGLY